MFELLSPPIRKFIRDKRWEFLRPIQSAAISKIMGSDEHVILASRTASGKTEAAFLPILSKVDFSTTGVKVLYISPLIALINDQFKRIEELCAYLDVPVTKWHGEASKSLKEKLVQNPAGVVLITPESLEAMLVNKPFNARKLFESLEFVVIDEIHSFIGSDRGIQLKSILSRLQYFNSNGFKVVGLSATIGDYVQAKRMTGAEDRTKVLLDKSSKAVEAEFKYYKAKNSDLPIELLKDLYLNCKDNKVLIFPNSRGRAEEIAVKLHMLSEKVGGHGNYFSHHSSVDKELREYIENFAKTNERYPFAIACTSTLELGIDIGSVEQVIQVDATFSIASLIQRIGRSGRRDGEVSKLLFYATDKWNLLQSLACFNLYKEGFIEPLSVAQKPYDILLHQILAYVKQLSGCSRSELMARIKSNYAFLSIDSNNVEEIISTLIQLDLLETIGGELIIGVEGEFIVNSKDFYSVFKTEVNYKVIYNNKPIGDIPYSPQIAQDENLLLAARIWKIQEVDHKAKKIAVIPALDGKKPIFMGSAGDIHPKIRERMLQILCEERLDALLSSEATEEMRAFRKEFQNYPIAILEEDRPLLVKEASIELFTFQGSRVNRSLAFLFKTAGISCISNELSSSFTFEGSSEELTSHIARALEITVDIKFHLQNLVIREPDILGFAKWASNLPLRFKCEILMERRFDFAAAIDFLERVNPLVYRDT